MSFRVLAAGVLGCAALVVVQVARSQADARIEAAKATFRSASPPAVSAAFAERDAGWRLGRTLFHDARLSASGKSACVTCHRADHGLSNDDPRAIGDGGQRLAFKAPTLVEVGTLDRLGWTGRFPDLAAVTTFAITSPTNMGMTLSKVVDRLRRDPAYPDAFRSAFGSDGIDEARVVRALGTYVASLSADAPFDRWIGGDTGAIGDDAKRGFALFTGKARCAECHSGAALTDGSYHDIGSSTADIGRGKFFKSSVKLQYAFKTPSLRGVADRAPYLHDGSAATLADVVDLYDRGGIERPSRADVIRPLHLTAGEKSDLVAFLKSLSGEPRYVLR